MTELLNSRVKTMSANSLALSHPRTNSKSNISIVVCQEEISDRKYACSLGEDEWFEVGMDRNSPYGRAGVRSKLQQSPACEASSLVARLRLELPNNRQSRQHDSATGLPRPLTALLPVPAKRPNRPGRPSSRSRGGSKDYSRMKTQK